MKQFLPTLLLLFVCTSVSAQKEANIWYFGRNAGLDFNTGVPVILTNGALSTAEGSAVICNKNGNLIFYTDGQKVWNRNHLQMPNGTGLNGHPSATSSAVIVPKPGNPDRYYIFTVGSHDQFSPSVLSIPFSWSEVDMSLNGGLGDVIPATKNTLLFTNSTEKIAAVKHANGLYVWVIGQEITDGRYRAYLVDCNGISAPVTGSAGHVTLASGLGYLKASPDGRRLANAIWPLGYFLYDFNNATGIISNPVALGLPSNWAYGVSFSPDNKLLYGTGLSDGVIYQWNLQAGSSAAIVASRTAIGNTGGTGSPYRAGAIQSAPDNKLYFVQYNQAYLGVINNPNVIGAGCNLQQNAVNLQNRTAVLGLPTFIQYNTDTIIINHTGHCLGLPVLFSAAGITSSLDSVSWQFGDPASGPLNTSGNLSPSHQYTSAGNFTVRLIKYLACISDTFYTTVKIDPLPIVSLGPDTVTCGDTIVLSSSGSYSSPSWLWSNGSVTPSIAVARTGIYWLEITENGCTGTDTIAVDINANLSTDLGADFNICDKDTPVVLRSSQTPGTRYLWSNGLSDTQMAISRSGTYWLQVSRGRCSGSDTIHIGIIPAPVVDIGRDSIICEQFPLQIGTEIPGATYLWNTGETTPYIRASSTNNYMLEVNLQGCIVHDTIQITAMPPPEINIGPDRDICPEQQVILDAAYETNSSYHWHTGETTPVITVSGAGIYSVQVTSYYHCTGNDTIILSHYPLPAVSLQADTAVCEETPLLLIPGQANADSLIWSDGTTGDKLEIRYGGRYIVTGINKCGTVSDTILISQIFCDIWTPNVFTPNGDGTNDIFRVLGNTGRLENFGLNIYNRWGERVFHTADKYEGWDGKYKGKTASLGTYVYMLRYTIAGKPYLQKGNFHLIR